MKKKSELCGGLVVVYPWYLYPFFFGGGACLFFF